MSHSCESRLTHNRYSEALHPVWSTFSPQSLWSLSVTPLFHWLPLSLSLSYNFLISCPFSIQSSLSLPPLPLCVSYRMDTWASGSLHVGSSSLLPAECYYECIFWSVQGNRSTSLYLFDLVLVIYVLICIFLFGYFLFLKLLAASSWTFRGCFFFFFNL